MLRLINLLESEETYDVVYDASPDWTDAPPPPVEPTVVGKTLEWRGVRDSQRRLIRLWVRRNLPGEAVATPAGNHRAPPKPDAALVRVEEKNIERLDWRSGGCTLELLPVSSLVVTEEGEKKPIYVDAVKSGKALPPLFVWHQGERSGKPWFEIWDGNRRFLSYKEAGFTHVWALVRRL